MSQINVKGVVKNHHVRSNVFTPLVEAVVNSIDAIEDRGISNGLIEVSFKRDTRPKLEGIDKSKPDVIGITITDNGIGFNKKNRNSFDTFYSSLKQSRGGKGFGRFTYKIYFRDVEIESIFQEENSYKKRTFNFGNDNDIIDKTSEKVENFLLEDGDDIKTSVSLLDLQQRTYPKELEAIAKSLLEKILVYFITDGYIPPRIVLIDDDGKRVVLNDLASNSKEILKVEDTTFEMIRDSKKEKFYIKIFKVFFPGNQNSKIILTADKREVVDTHLHEYVPEFRDEFYETVEGKETKNNFIIKAYVLGSYLNNNVTAERDKFFFEKEKELFYPFSRNEIEQKTIDFIEKIVPKELESRKEKKYKKVDEFLKENPWYKELKKEINWNNLPMNPTEENIETEVHSISYKKERNAKQEISKILKDFDNTIPEEINKVFLAIDQVKKSNLAHYVALRRVFLDILKRALAIKDDGKKNEKENLLHNIIFPTKKDSDQVLFSEHNLWILDERLNFVEYLRSDMKLSDEKKRRPDILVFDHGVSFRGGDEPSNPITIFEFKRPGRDDFADKGSKEDPHDQVIDYVESIKDGKYTTPEGREIKVGVNTPFFSYIIADKSIKVEKWLERNDFSPLPDNQRWFKWQKKYNLYIEFITWDQLLKDAELRNKIFFNKLGI